MNCQQVHSKLSPFLDGELEASVRSAVRTHLENCPDCSLYYEELKSLNNDLKLLLEPDSFGSKKFPERIRASAREEIERRGQQKDNRAGSSLTNAARSGLAAVTLAIGLIGGTYLGFGFMEVVGTPEPTSNTSPSVAVSERRSMLDQPEATPVVSYSDAYFELADANSSSGRP